MRPKTLRIVALRVALQLSIIVTITEAHAFVVPETCVGDQDDDGAVSVGELVRGVGYLLGEGSDYCSVFDADRSGRVEVNEMVTAVDHALHGCGVVHREDFSDFRQFHFSRESALGFCPPLDAPYAASIRVDAGGYSLQLWILEEGKQGVDECLPDVFDYDRCLVARSEPIRYLNADETARVLDVFRTVVIHDAPNPICRGCIIDPCLINSMRWDTSFTADYICQEGGRLDELQVASIIDLLEDLRKSPANLRSLYDR